MIFAVLAFGLAALVFFTRKTAKSPTGNTVLAVILTVYGMASIGSALDDRRKAQAAAQRVDPVTTTTREWSPDQRIAWKAVGCASPDELQQLQRLYTQDKQEWGVTLAAWLDSGACRSFEQGELVHVIDNTLSVKQVRPEGSTSAYWLPMEAAAP